MMYMNIKAKRIESMKARDSKTTSLLGLVISELDRAQNYTDEMVIKTITSMIANMRECLNRVDAGSLEAQSIVHEISVLEPWLPPALCGSELYAKIDSILATIENPSMRSMGIIMKDLNTYTKANNMILDGSEVKDYVTKYFN